MVDRNSKGKQIELQEIHQYYSAILNCMPYLVYWVDTDCNMQGCNAQVSHLLDLKNLHDFSGDPYEKLAKATQWTAKMIEAFRLDDMSVLFSGQPLHDKQLPPMRYKDGSTHHFICHRDPIFNQTGKVIGAVVVLIETTDSVVIGKPHFESKIQATTREGQAPRVLIVEDNIVAKQVEESLLLALNCVVDCADSGQQALALFQPGKYDLVIMDIGLEDTSGYVLSKQFRQLEKETTFHVPIIALTSFQADLVKYDCEYYFMDGVISKPLTAEQADQIVQHYIYRKNTTVKGLKYA
ncbi:MAG TPA: response regulator [Legionellaceae bacterium]|nr:response regulator [Legionellaceae bacterium]